MKLEMGRVMTKQELVTFLQKVSARIEAGDSFEGRLAYSCLEDGLKPDEWAVEAAYRVGNREGQGGVSIVQKPEAVNHPKHYNAHSSGVEAIDLCELLSFNIGNAVKYLFRADHKGALVEDLKKAKWYLERAYEKKETALVVQAEKAATAAIAKRVYEAEPYNVLTRVVWELFDSRIQVLERYKRAIEIVGTEIKRLEVK